MIKTIYTISVRANDKKIPKNGVYIHWKDAQHDEYSWVWLRDNCQCLKCYNVVAKNRMMLMQDLDVNIKPLKIATNEYQVISQSWNR